MPEPERRRILAERHAGDPPPAHGGVGYRGLMRSPSMWGLAISQGCAVYSLYLYLSWLPNYLSTARHLSILKSGVFTAVPFLVGLGARRADQLDRRRHADAGHDAHRRRRLVVGDLPAADGARGC